MKNTNVYKKQSIGFPEDLTKAIAFFQNERKIKNFSDAVIQLIQLGLENQEYSEHLISIIRQELEKNSKDIKSIKEQNEKNTNRIIAVQNHTGKNLFALKDTVYKAEIIKSTFTPKDNESEKEIKDRIKMKEQLLDKDKTLYANYFKNLKEKSDNEGEYHGE